MKIAANLGVLDEVELIGHCVDHLRNIGVDLIVVTDVGSTDGTLEFLKEMSCSSDVVLIERDTSKRLLDFGNYMYRMTVEKFSADYILTLDADEFWLPASGNIRNTKDLGTFDVASVIRFNVPIFNGTLMMPIPCNTAKYNEVFLYVRPVVDAQFQFKTDPNLTQSMIKVGPKVLVKGAKVSGLIMGGHSALEENSASVTVPMDLVIAHVAFSTLDRFLRKIGNVRRTLERHGETFPQGAAWHWRRWEAIASQGSIEEEFNRQSFSSEAFHAAQLDGTIQSAQQWLDGNRVK